MNLVQEDPSTSRNMKEYNIQCKNINPLKSIRFLSMAQRYLASCEIWWKLTTISLLSVLGHSYPSSPTTTLAQGQLKGRWMATREGRTVAGFLGIPYALAPVGELRFKSPQQVKPWKGVFSATKDAPACIQPLEPPVIPGFTSPTASEDCLYLNVFTPGVKPLQKLAVLVFIFGGSFEQGTSSSFIYGPDYLLDEDIILVTFNYRLGILGFLSLDHPVLPGNLGIKDQRAALRWVKDNIEQFGGDPKRITISGESVGAISAHFHIISEANEGLFRAGITQSSTARSIWELQSPNPQRALVEKLIEKTKCPSDPVKLVDCLKQLPANEFPNLLRDISMTSSQIKKRIVILQPVIEPECVEDAVITNNPWNTTISYPLLQGANEIEGLYSITGLELDKTNKAFEEMNENYKSILPYNLFFEHTAENPKEMAEMLKQFYFGDNKIDRKHFKNLINLFSDAFSNYPLVKTARANKGRTFFYQLNYHGSNSIVRYISIGNYYGVSHADELFYLFPLGGAKVRNITKSDTAFSKQMVKLWANFVKNLDPTPNGLPTKWDPVTSSSIEFLNIGQHGFKMDRDFLKHRIDFWENLPFRNKQQKGQSGCKKEESS